MARTTRHPRLQVEALERRDTPTIEFNSGWVTVYGDETGSATNDTVILSFDANGRFVVTLNNQSEDYGPNEVSQVSVYALGGTNTLKVERTNADVFVDSDGADTVHLSQIARDLDHVQGTVTFEDGSTDDTIVLYDQAAAPGPRYDLGYQFVRSTGRMFGGLEYDDGRVEVELHVRDAGAAVEVTGGPAEGATRLFGGAGADTFDFWFDTAQQPGYLGRYEVTGNGMTDTVTVEVDAFRAGLNEYDISGWAIGLNDRVNATAPLVDRLDVTFASVESVRLESNGDPSTFYLTAAPAVPMTIIGDAGADTLRGAPTTNTWTLAGAMDSRVGNVTFENVERLRGGSKTDRFDFQPGGRVWDSLDGGVGTDTLNYAAFTAGVTVSLFGWSAPQVSGRVLAVENVTGTQFPDSLRGHSLVNQLTGLGGDDTLFGGSGNDVVYAGAGNDRVYGEDGDDILYGGSGDDRLWGYEGNDALFGQGGKDVLSGHFGRDILFGGADPDTLDGEGGDDIVSSAGWLREESLPHVQAVLAEWTSTHTYADRVANLRGDSANSTTWTGRMNGNYFLTTIAKETTLRTVILGTAKQDELTGGPTKPGDTNQDWFFGLSAEFLDRQVNEEANG